MFFEDNMNIVINGITKRQTRKCNMKEIENAIISYLESKGNFFSKVIIKTIRFSKSNLDKDNKLKELTSKFNCQRFMVWTGDGNQAIECYIERTEWFLKKGACHIAPFLFFFFTFLLNIYNIFI